MKSQTKMAQAILASHGEENIATIMVGVRASPMMLPSILKFLKQLRGLRPFLELSF
jgi:hypothetical protein